MLKKTAVNEVREPNAFLFYSTYFLARIYYRLVYGLIVDKSSISGIKPPFLVVASHSCWLDYLITGISMYPIRMNYVAAYNFFRDRFFKFLFNLMGVISKYQFTNDLTAVKKMKQVIDRGGVVSIFPNGCLSNDGRPGGFAVFGIAKLVRFLGVPVVAIKTDGGYLTRPRWTKRARHGRLEVRMSQILTAEDVKLLSEAEIYARVTGSIAFDDYKWQRERMIPYKGKRLAEGVEYVLFKCPKCRSEFTLRSKRNRLYCTACGYAVRMNVYSFFEPESENTVFFDGIDKWYDYQKESVEIEIQNPAFKLTAKTELRCAEPGKYGYQHLGSGTVSLTREAVTYTGTVAGELRELVLPMRNIIMVPYAAGEYIEISKGPDVNRFIFEDPRQQIKWVMAVRQIRDKYYEGEGESEDDQEGRSICKDSIRLR